MGQKFPFQPLSESMYLQIFATKHYFLRLGKNGQFLAMITTYIKSRKKYPMKVQLAMSSLAIHGGTIFSAVCGCKWV